MFKGRSTGRRFGRRRFGRPLARKRLIWVTTRQTATEVAGSATVFSILTPSQWEDNTSSGNTAQYCKVLRCIWSLRTTQVATAEARVFAVCHDDSASPPGNPDAAAFYSTTDVCHFGIVSVPAVSSTVAQHNSGITPVEGQHLSRVLRKFKQDEDLWLALSPAAAAGNQLSYTLLTRTLVQLG